jgi:hypothetical protein
MALETRKSCVLLGLNVEINMNCNRCMIQVKDCDDDDDDEEEDDTLAARLKWRMCPEEV